MKHTIIFLFLLTSGSLMAEDDVIKSDSKIDKVTVFISGAQVQRSGAFYIQSGVQKIAFENVSPYIDANTLQARGQGDFTIMDVVFETFYPEPDNTNPNQDEIPVEIRNRMLKLSDSITQITYDIEEIMAIKEVYTLERNMLLNNGTVKGTGKVNDSIPLLKDAMVFFHQKMTEINLELFKLKKKEDRYKTQKSAMDKRYADLQNWRYHNNMVVNKDKGPIYRVVVTVSTEKPVRGNLEVAYIVSQAGWKPSYDLRAKNANTDIELNYKAEVYQATGIDWDKIPLTLSTSNPYKQQQKPNLSTWYISYYDPIYYKKQSAYYDMNSESELKEEESRAGEGVGGTNFQPAQKALVDAKIASDLTQVTNTLISAEYNINLPYSIKSNNKPHIVAVTKKNLSAEYSLALVPKLDKNAFLVANVTEWEDLNLIPAKARIYYDGVFIGHSFIDPTVMEDTLKLAMGRDNSVSAIRKKLKDKTKEKIIGDSKLKETHYEISIKNSHGYAVDLIVEDQIPVSNNSDIKVELLDAGKADVNEYTGILTWRFKMRPGGSEKIGFSYSVKYDKNKNLSMAF